MTGSRKDFGSTIAGAFYDEPTMYRAQGRTVDGQVQREIPGRPRLQPDALLPGALV